MMLEFEGFQACGAFELAKIRTVRVIRHMPLQLGQVGKLLGANGAWLQEIDSFIIPFLCINIMCTKSILEFPTDSVKMTY